MQDNIKVGTCTSAYYYENNKCIRFTLQFDDGRERGFEWPMSMFRFPSGSDRDAEMKKTAKLLLGKKLSWNNIKEE